MKWKESGEMNDSIQNKEEYFDEEQYSPWAKRNASVKVFKLDRSRLVFILLIVAIVTSMTALAMLLLGRHGGPANSRELAALQQKVNQLEDRLSKYDAIDEKVTRIWEQAKSFEKFKDRFDRGEASMSLRMDHITMSLEKLQQQFSDIKSSSISSAAALQPPSPAAVQRSSSSQVHTVAAGDTFYSIGKRYNIEVEKLLKMNGLGKSSLLHIGQKLIVKSEQNN